MNATATMNAAGRLGLRVTLPPRRSTLGWRVRNFFAYRIREAGTWLAVALLPVLRLLAPGLMVCHQRLSVVVRRRDGTVEDYGVVGRHLVVTAGKNYLAACMDNTSEPENLKYHGFGTGTTAAAAGDTALQTECTTAYATDNTRPTGSQTHSTNTYTTVGTFAPDASVACTEWGLFSQAANSGGTLFDRQVFSAVNLVSGDTLAATYVLTFS